MPDLDQIKQGEQGCGTGAGGSPGAARAIPPAGCAAAATTSTAPSLRFPRRRGNLRERSRCRPAAGAAEHDRARNL
jgi:hypothetical protein